MNQEDFRRLVATGGSHGTDSGRTSKSSNSRSFGGKRNLNDDDLQEIKRMSAKKPKNASKKRGQHVDNDNNDDGNEQSQAKQKVKAMKPKYRDRAAERRMGLQSDMIDVEEFAHLDAEKTKFLGGDLAHTHLVKGLDFALLAQLKRDKEKLLEATKAAKAAIQQSAGGLKSTSSGSTTGEPRSEPCEVTFKSAMARLVYLHACTNANTTTGANATATTTTKVESFLPGRMLYRFNLHGRDFDSVPLMVHFSKEDCPDSEALLNGRLNQLVVDQISDVLTNKKRRRKRKLGSTTTTTISSASTTTTSTPETTTEFVTGSGTPMYQEDEEQGTLMAGQVEEEDEDIFADAGEYVPSYLRAEQDAKSHQEAQPSASSSGRSGSASDSGSGGRGQYFVDLSATLTQREQDQAALESAAEANAWKDTLRHAMHQRAQSEQIKHKQQQALAKAKLASEAEYSDSYQMMNAAAYYDSDNDDDDDIGQKTSASKKKKKKNKNKVKPSPAPDT